MLIDCINCNITIEGELIAEYSSVDTYSPMDGLQYSMIKCPKCCQPVLIKSELILIGNQIEWGQAVKIFPVDEFHVNPIIPEKIRNALLESIKCYKGNSYTATVIMCRRTLEGFCIVKGIEEKNLAKSIFKLKEKGIINDQLFEWADQLRVSGNEAAHNIDNVFTATDAKDILDFTIAILDFTYSFKDKFDKFKKRKA